MDEVTQSQPQTESSSRISQAQAVTELLKNLEAYYGSEYNETQKRIISAYLLDIDPSKYSRLYGNVIRVKLYSAKLPLVEHFDEALGKIDSSEYIEPMYRMIEEPKESGERCDPERAFQVFDQFYQKFRLSHGISMKK